MFLLIILQFSYIAAGLPNLSFLERGYDVFQGYPRSHRVDLGFVEQVLNLSSVDAQGVSNNVEVDRYKICNFGSETVIIVKGGSSLQESLLKDAGIVIDPILEEFSAAFTGSQIFSETLNAIQNSGSVYVETVANCMSHKAKYRRLEIANGFRNAVEKLPLEYENNSYWYITFLQVTI